MNNAIKNKAAKVGFKTPAANFNPDWATVLTRELARYLIRN